MKSYDLMVLICPGILAAWVEQNVISLDGMLIVKSQVDSPCSNIVEAALVTLSQLPCVATPLHTQCAVCVMNYPCGTRRVKVLFCCSRHNLMPSSGAETSLAQIVMSLLLISFQDFLQEYGWPVLQVHCDCTWRHARVLFATYFTFGYSLLPLPLWCTVTALHVIM